MPRLRVALEDFVVDELPLYEPAGEGAHTFVLLEKRARTTDAVLRDLARSAGVPRAAVGCAGRKDRRAVARQWFSVPELAPERALGLRLSGVRVLQARRHPHKLRTGQLRGNRFVLRVREVDAAQAVRARERAESLRRQGLPNRFGAQRFGRDGRNAERGRDLLAGRARVRDRREGRFLLSALQAAVFDEVLARRPLALDRLETGDVAVVHASGGLFRVEDATREQPRATAFEISATGPIFGTGSRDPVPGGAVAGREDAALRALGLEATALTPPRGIRLRGARRPLRVCPCDLEFEVAEDVLLLRFTLPPGSYATVLVEELFGGPVDDTGGGPAVP